MGRKGGGLDAVLELVAHDLRNQLGAVVTAAEVLVRRPDLPEGAGRTVERLRSSAERLTIMIDQGQEWARAQLGHALELDRGEVDVHEICRAVIDDLPPEHAPRVALELVGDGRGTWDEARLSQALATLAGNALDHGAERAPVQLRAAGDAKTVRLEVANQGPPIAPELQPLLFDPVALRRRKRPVRARGLGFGLWLARAIAVAHGGRLDVRSSKDGTIFTLKLPR